MVRKTTKVVQEPTTTTVLVPESIIGNVSLQLPDSAEVQESLREEDPSGEKVDTITLLQIYQRANSISPESIESLPKEYF